MAVTLDKIPIIDTSKDPLAEYTAAESAKKINQINSILNQRMGSNWKNILFYCIVFIMGVFLLLTYGISAENQSINNGLGHLKALCMCALLAGALTIVWLSTKPYRDTTVYGVAPYPTSHELIPPDSSQCGRVPTMCDPLSASQTCKKLCTENTGSGGKKVSNNYECVKPDHPNVYYLGTKLNSTQYYCLPKQAKATISTCDQQNGKVVWTLKSDGTQGWDCQCLYPDIFGGKTCGEQLICDTGIDSPKGRIVDNLASGLKAETDQYGRYKYMSMEEQVIEKSNGNTTTLLVPKWYWDSWNSPNPPFVPGGIDTSNISGIIKPPRSPYETIQDPRYPNDPNKRISRFQCYCPGGYISIDGDPFVCHSDICLNGGSYGNAQASTSGFFDHKDQVCKCDVPTVKTNINGACYTVSYTKCKPHRETQYCTYGWRIILPANKSIMSTENYVAKVTPSTPTPLMIVINVDSNNNITTSSSAPKKYLCADTYAFKPDVIQECFIDVTDIVDTIYDTDALKSKFYDLTSTDEAHKNVRDWLFDTLSAFPIKHKRYSISQLTKEKILALRATDLDLINTLAGNGDTQGPKGVVKACDSFYFQRNGIGIVGELNTTNVTPKMGRCADILSKTGSEFIEICNPIFNQCGSSSNQCVIDLSRKTKGIGYKCICNSSGQVVMQFDGVGCGVKIAKGVRIPNRFDRLCTESEVAADGGQYDGDNGIKGALGTSYYTNTNEKCESGKSKSAYYKGIGKIPMTPRYTECI